MFNKETYEKIRNIPHIKGIATEDLPKFLTKVYARIITVKEDLQNIHVEDYEKLSILANTLEIIVLTGDIKDDLIKNAAFVGASARQLLDMVSTDEQNSQISLYSIPYSVTATLMFAISGHLADAKEMSKRIQENRAETPWSLDLLWGIKALMNGDLQNLASKLRAQVHYDVSEDFDTLAENLVFAKLFDCLKNAASYFLGIDKQFHAMETLEKIHELSVHEIPGFNQQEIFTGTLILSGLLLDTLNILKSHSCINVPSPDHISPVVWKSHLKYIAKTKPFLWENHLDAIEKKYLDNGISSVITFPTGAGKTTLINLKILSSLISGKSVLYLVPTHALERQVAEDMKSLGTSVSVFSNMDSEISQIESSEEVKIVIMTPERCLTRISGDSESLLDNVGLIVFDEFHLISGTVEDKRAPVAMAALVELLYRIPEADYLLSSAMVKNGEEIRKWISLASQHRCILLDNAWKPTCQLQGCIIYSTKDVKKLRYNIKTLKKSGVTPKSKKMCENLWITPYCFYSLKSIWDSLNINDYYFSPILDREVPLTANKWYNLTSNCNIVASEIASKFSINGKKVIIFASQPSHANSICDRLDEIYIREKYPIQSVNWDIYKEKIAAVEAELGGWEYSYLSKCTVATQHHALLLDYERAISEDLFLHSSAVDVIAATPTISQGINLPSDIVIIAGSSHFNQDVDGFEQIKAHDLLNAVGRAGRAGYRSHGAALLIPSSVIDYENNQIYKDWMKLREEIFSQGDRCLEIEDPLSFIFDDKESDYSHPIILRIQGDESELEGKIRKTFYYYQHQNNPFNIKSITENLISARKKDSNNIDWCSELAIKIGLKESHIYLIDESIPDEDIENASQLSIMDMIIIINYLFYKIPDVLYSILTQSLTEMELQNLLNIKDSDQFSDKSEYIAHVGELVCDLMVQYVEGVPLASIEKTVLHKDEKLNKHLNKGRKIALRLIPALAYVCSLIDQIFINKAKRLGYTNMSDEVLHFASCIKEGVSTKQMLLSKADHRWMRVETHQKFAAV